ncbi:MAG TPA: O-antigen ligase family protein [Alphaproteobacteria bacterium]|nr:hypothetical protein [Rhodospirillaceae bacterium]HRJ11634.1 O-antigen ligase family protein [Alphaproteobacteria bacterium]
MIGLAKPVWNYAGYAMLALVALSPLTLGAVAPWAWTSLALAAGLVLLAVAIPTLQDYGAPAFYWRDLRASAMLFLIPLVWAFIQLSPVPAAWQHPIWDVTRDIVGDVRGAISLNPSDGLQIITRWLMYVAIFLIAYVWGRDARRSMQALNVLVIAATVYALYGLIIIFIGSDLALWVHKPLYITDVSGPFINRNNFASYAGAILCVALGLLLRRILHEVTGVSAHEFWRRLIGVLLGRAWYLTLAVVILFVALLLTHSRAGLASFAVGFVVLLMMLRLAGLLQGKMFFWGAGIIGGSLIGIFLLSGEGVFARLISESEVARPQLYALQMNALADRPWLGSGLGSFPQIFHIYRTEDIPLYFFTERGHSVYLENMVELGLFAAFALFISIGILIWRVIASVTLDARHRTIPAVSVAAITVLCVHSLIDFPLQIPAITMTFAWLLGLGMAQTRE